MSIISFDVGIRNMGYCIFNLNEEQLSAQPFEILDWGILNLTQPTNSIVYLCNCSNETKTKTKTKQQCKNAISIACNKIAKYVKTQPNGHIQYYCKKHATNSDDDVISNIKPMLSNLKKSSKEIIIQKCKDMNIEIQEKDTKPHLFLILENHIKQNSILPIQHEKQSSANDIDLVSIGKQMRIMLDRNPHIDKITHAIIENQISPIANRMKTIQGMLAQYFIMKNINTHIDFVSSANKLKQFSNISNPEFDSIDIDATDSSSKLNNLKSKYKEHKKDGIYYCDVILSKNDWLSEWSPKINIKKKDDLADCFLQGLWYLKKIGHIQYSDSLQITRM